MPVLHNIVLLSQNFFFSGWRPMTGTLTDFRDPRELQLAPSAEGSEEMSRTETAFKYPNNKFVRNHRRVFYALQTQHSR